MPVDVRHPTARLRNMLEDTHVQLVLTSAEFADHEAFHGHQLMIYGEEQVNNHGHQVASHSTNSNVSPKYATPRNAAYALFTSGTTGRPKAFVMEHQAFCSSAMARKDVIRRTKTSRVLQFASFTFDPSMEDIFTTLMVGGCICIPTEEERLNDLTDFIQAAQVNFANLTPSVSDLLDPDSVPSLRVLLLSGEAMNESHVRKWATKLQLMNGYGPSECCVKCAVNPHVRSPEDSSNIGFPVGCRCWIVEPDDPQKLAPAGTIGELVIEGPSLARGYLGQRDSSASAFLDCPPPWHKVVTQSSTARFYKTGDLVRQQPDGSLVFIGRKGTQVKVIGQRVELGEIEACITFGLSPSSEVRVDLVKCETAGIDVLTAFIRSHDDHADKLGLPAASGVPDLRLLKHEEADLIKSELQMLLPEYMIPREFISASHIPVTINGKTNRALLRDLGAKLLAQKSSPTAAPSTPLSEEQIRMANIWAKVLRLEPQHIRPGDHFFRLRAADSLTAIKLVAEARACGLTVTVKDVFAHPILEDMAAIARNSGPSFNAEIQPFALVKKFEDTEALLDRASTVCGIQRSDIEDMYPATLLQTELMAFSERHPGAFMAQYVHHLDPEIADIQKFKTAWTEVARSCAILRTSLLYTQSTDFFQVVDRNDIEWSCRSDITLDEFLTNDQALPIGFGEKLTRYAVIHDPNTQKVSFVWTAHHSAYDRWSLNLLIKQVESTYNGLAMNTPATKFSRFVEAVSDLPTPDWHEYWGRELADAAPPAFPPTQNRSEIIPNKTLARSFSFCRASHSDITTSTIVRAAWALILSKYENSEDVTFGALVTGRAASVDWNIDAVVGPTISTVPVRVNVSQDLNVGNLLKNVQEQSQSMIPFEQTGIQNIKSVGESANLACSFRNLLIVQAPLQEKTADEAKGLLMDLERQGNGQDDLLSYALTLECTPTENQKMLVNAAYNSSEISTVAIEWLLAQFEHVLAQLCVETYNAPLRSIHVVPSEHEAVIHKWNANPASHSVASVCLPELLKAKAMQLPENLQRPAICSWDGEMTYAELDTYSDRLAQTLSAHDVGPEVCVALAFEKSMWAVVAMLGVLKAGGVVVALDPSHPPARRHTILKETGAKLILTSKLHYGLFDGLNKLCLIVSESIKHAVACGSPEGDVVTKATPQNAAFIVFTSGSTGRPKGIVLEHQAICTSILSHGPIMGFSSNSRVLQFAAYTFDVSIGDIFTTLAFGGCVCIPSEEDRLDDLAGAIRSLGVNQAYLTSTVAGLLEPSQVPGLKTLAVGGEMVQRDVLTRWSGAVNLINMYGPAECSVWCSGKDRVSAATDRPDDVGQGLGCQLWIADIADHDKLAALGTVGELLIEGPLLARGYLNDRAKTDQSFITNPRWARLETETCTRRFYCSGDLAKYADDGSILIMGRRDTQVKLRGQRVELGEIESTMRQLLPANAHAVVEVMKPLDGNEILVSFIAEGSTTAEKGDAAGPDDPIWLSSLNGLAGLLSQRLPSYMVPSLFVPVAHIPVSVSGKTNRKELQRIFSKLSLSEIRSISASSMQQRAPALANEVRMAELWAKVLKAKSTMFFADDHFFRVGGDSVSAMRLAAAARDAGLHLSVAAIFHSPVLSDMARAAYSIDHDDDELPVPPFSLLDDSESLDELRRQASEQCRVPGDLIDDIYPCTALQEGLMALSGKEPNSYIAQFAFQLPKSLDVDRFVRAWNTLIDLTPIFRTRFICTTKQRFLQVVFKRSSGCSLIQNHFEQFLEQDSQVPIRLGDPLMRFVVIKDSGTGFAYLLWTAHHGSYDALSLRQTILRVQEIYNTGTVSPYRDYNTFIDHLLQTKPDDEVTFWEHQLQGASEPSFPRLPASDTPVQAVAREYVQSSMRVSRQHGSFLTLATLVRASWGLLLSTYENSEDVVFGTIVNGRNYPLAGIETIIGPTFAAVPFRVKAGRGQTVHQFLESIQKQAVDSMPFEQVGIQAISSISPHMRAICDFRTFMLIQAADGFDQAVSNSDLGLKKVYTGADDLLTYPLGVECTLGADEIKTQIAYDPLLLSKLEVDRLSSQMEHILQQLCSIADTDTTTCLSHLNLVGRADMDTLLSWNMQESLAKAPEESLQSRFEWNAAHHPDLPAISFQDVSQSVSYNDLNKAADSLARALMTKGAVPGAPIPICTEKTPLAVLAMLAVLKLGGHFIPLDPSQPPSRLHSIASLVDPALVVVSAETAYIFTNTSHELFTVTPQLWQEEASFDQTAAELLPTVRGRDLAYMIFTSGSTGTPKGVMIEHGAICSSIRAHETQLEFTPESRVLQGASFAFDVAIAEIFSTLSNGGCVCIPSDDQKKYDIVAAMNAMKVTTACFTPAIVQSLRLAEVPSLQVLIVGGDKLQKEVIDTWAKSLVLINGYGPTEASVLSVLRRIESTDAEPSVIGKSVGCLSWIVDPEDSSRLLPIGAVGEMLLQGPLLARGYHGDPQRTDDAFVWQQPFGVQERSSPRQRFYKTGDLVRYTPEGLLDFVGRKDHQVKIRGQRVELGDIESRIRFIAPEFGNVAVDLVSHKDRADSQMIIAYLCILDKGVTHPTAPNLVIVDDDLRSTLLKLQQGLRDHLPSYMIPSAFLPFRQLPVGTSGKVDRRTLRTIVNGLSLEELKQYFLESDSKTPASTPMEIIIQQLWADTLHLKPDAIGANESFFQVGGDSISSMHLSSAAQRNGLDLSVETVFKYPILSEMAHHVGYFSDVEPAPISPFALVPPKMELDAIRNELAACCSIDAKFIEDIYPCTALQEGFMTLSIKEAGFGIAQHVWKIPDRLDLTRFRGAWDGVAGRHPILRTRIAQLSAFPQMMQVVLRDTISSPWKETVDLHAYLRTDLDTPMDFGHPLIRTAIVTEEDESRYFVLTMHHAVYDGWMLDLILKDVERLYNQQVLDKPSPPFTGFIQHLMTQDGEVSKTFWTNQLDGALPPTFPEVPVSLRPTADRELLRTFNRPRIHGSNITISTLLRAAWGLLVSKYSETEDVVFAATLNGRTTPVRSVDLIVGPTVTTVPVRIRYDKSQTVEHFLGEVQHETVATIPHEQFGVQNMRRLNAECNAACQFRSLLLMQVPEETTRDGEAEAGVLGLQSTREGSGLFHPYPLMIECTVSETSLDVRGVYDARIVDPVQMNRILQQLEHVVGLLSADSHVLLGDLDFMSPGDLAELASWNAVIPAPTNRCVHELVEESALIEPDAPAVCSWEGELTYRELMALADALAIKLRSLGICAGTLVPLLFEKSIWTIVTMLAVLRAGGANVALDPAHPEDRLRGLVEEVDATIMLASRTCAEKASRLLPTVLSIDEAYIRSLMEQTSAGKSEVVTWDKQRDATPSSPAFILFTSGSTGKPKGIIITHTAFASSMVGHAETLRYERGFRNFQFTAYTSDVSMGEIFTSLSRGSCVCVPSDYERMNDIAGAMERMRVDWAFFTPSVASLLNPNDVPTLKVLLYGGETATPENISMWANRLYLINSFGPAETCIWCHANPGISVDDIGSNIGYGVKCLTWIVDPDDYNKLMPIGTIGELLVEGPNVAQGYLKNPEKTAAAFIENPAWMPADAPRRRIYRLGDLARYMPDGKVQFMGRRDAQVKLRGQRIELGEIEFQLRECVPEIKEVAVEMVRLAGLNAPKTLAAFMSLDVPGQPVAVASSVEHTERFHSLINGLDRKLSLVLPNHMIPTLYFPLLQMPMTASAKTDRKALRQIAGGIDLQDMTKYTLSTADKKPPSTAREKELQSLWACTLQIVPEAIGAEDNFFSIGGDSVSAMLLVSVARRAGWVISVKEIFQHPVLDDMALAITRLENGPVADPDPFSLLDSGKVSVLLEEAAAECEVDSAAIDDIYPCTPLQEGMIAISTKDRGAYLGQFVLPIPDFVDMEKLERAWASVVQRCPTLRTRVARPPSSTRLLQVVVAADNIRFPQHQSHLQDFLERDFAAGMPLGQPLARCAVVYDPVDGPHLVFTAHHATYDHQTMSLLYEAIRGAYMGDAPLPLSGFNRFIQHLQDTDYTSARQFWTRELENAPAESFPASSAEQDLTTGGQICTIREFDIPARLPPGTTISTILRTSWPITLGRYLDSFDVVYGTTTSGRGAAVDGIDHMPGPTLATLPIRVVFSREDFISDLLASVQMKGAHILEFESFGLQNIKRVSDDARVACDFRNMLQIRTRANPAEDSDFLNLKPELGANMLFGSFPLMVECETDGHGIRLVTNFNSSIIDATQVSGLLDLFQHVILQIVTAESGMRVADLELITSADSMDVISRQMTQKLPSIPEQCVQQLLDLGMSTESVKGAWVVDPDDLDKLAASGTVGELVLECLPPIPGPTSNLELATYGFCKRPEFLPAVGQEKSVFFRTGQLVRHAVSGALEYLRRKSTRAAPRGTDLNFISIQQHIREGFPDVLDCVVQHVEEPIAARRQALAAFMVCSESLSSQAPESGDSNPRLLSGTSTTLYSRLVELRGYLRGRLPASSVPIFYVPVTSLPRDGDGEVDKALLQQLLASQPQELLEAYSLKRSNAKQMPTTDADIQMQELWMKALGRSLEEIGVHDNFFQLGGDSVGE